MIKLAKKKHQRGSFPAWAVKITRGKLFLNKAKSNPAYSAADADLDLIMALMRAQKNVAASIWQNQSNDKKKKKYPPAAKKLFEKAGTTYVMKPSEEWD